MSYKHMLYATDLKANHFALCEKAVKFARHHDAALYFLHVIEVPSTLFMAQILGFAELVSPAKDDAQLTLQALGEALNVPVSHQYVEIGSVKQHILEKAQALHCELIMLGSNTHRSLPRPLGSTSYSVMQHALCDVLILHA